MILDVWKGLEDLKSSSESTLAKGLLHQETAREEAIRFVAEKKPFSDKECCVIYSVVDHEPDLDIVTRISIFRETIVSESKLGEIIKKFPHAETGVLYPGQELACRKIMRRRKSREFRPISFKEANHFLELHHRHHGSVAGGKFALGLYEEESLIGVSCCGRPVSRVLDDGRTLEINRLCCLSGSRDACSMLYSRSCVVAEALGYRKVITYILESETGSSLRASGFVLEARCVGGKEWTGRRSRENREKATGKKEPAMELKQRWVRFIGKQT